MRPQEGGSFTSPKDFGRELARASAQRLRVHFTRSRQDVATPFDLVINARTAEAVLAFIFNDEYRRAGDGLDRSASYQKLLTKRCTVNAD